LVIGASQAGAAPPHLSPAQLVNDAVDAANTAGTLEFIDRTKIGNDTQILTGSISAPAAAERLQTTGQQPISVQLLGSNVYFNAGAPALQGVLGLSATTSQAYSGKWISLQESDAPFSNLTNELTIASELNTYIPSTHLVMGKPTTIAGHRVIPVSGRPSSSPATQGKMENVALFVSVSSPHLPVGGTLTLVDHKKIQREVAAFSEWGRPVNFSAPVGATPFGSLS